MKFKKIITSLIAFAMSGVLLTGCNLKKPNTVTAAVLTETGAERLNSRINRPSPENAVLRSNPWLKAAGGSGDAKAGDLVTDDMIFEIYPHENVNRLLLIGNTKGEDLPRNNKGSLLAAGETTETPLVTIESPIANEDLGNYILNGIEQGTHTLKYNTEAEIMVKYEYINRSTHAGEGFFCQPTFKLVLIDNEPAQTLETSFSKEVSYSLSATEMIETIKSDVLSKFSTNDPTLTLDIVLNKTEEAIGIERQASIVHAIEDGLHGFIDINLKFKIVTGNNVETEWFDYTLKLIDDIGPDKLVKNGVETTELTLNVGTRDLVMDETFKEYCKNKAVEAGYKLHDDILGYNTDFDFEITENGNIKLELSSGRSIIDTTTKMKDYNQFTDIGHYHYFEKDGFAYAFEEDADGKQNGKVIIAQKYDYFELYNLGSCDYLDSGTARTTLTISDFAVNSGDDIINVTNSRALFIHTNGKSSRPLALVAEEIRIKTPNKFHVAGINDTMLCHTLYMNDKLFVDEGDDAAITVTTVIYYTLGANINQSGIRNVNNNSVLIESY